MRPRQLAAMALAWWLGELRACIPTPLRRAYARRRKCLRLLIDGDSIAVQMDTGGRRTALGTIAGDPLRPEPARASLRKLIRGRLTGWSEIQAVLPANAALRRRLTLPAAVSENLQESIGFELDRLTPFRAEQVVFSAQVAELDRRAGRIHCYLTVVPRARVESILRWAERLDLRLDRVSVDGSTEGEPSDVDQPAPKPGGGGRGWRMPVTLACITLLLGAIALGISIHRKEMLLDAYTAEIAKSRKAALAAGILRERIVKLSSLLNQTAARRQDYPLLADVLADLTQRLPDDTWLTELRLTDRQLSLTGYAANAASLVPLIDRSKLFADARLSAPVTSDGRLLREHFGIDANLRPGAAP